MRVRAGTLKGRRLTSPAGRMTRPTADQVRVACLDTLMPYLPRGAFLDLFAGAGAVGIEALSRGAPSAVFVEEDVSAFGALADNVERLGIGDRARLVCGDAVEALGRDGQRYAVVFLDPPYGSPRAAATLARLAAGDCLEPGAVVVMQHATKSPPPPATGVLRLWKTRRFGESALTFFRSDA